MPGRRRRGRTIALKALYEADAVGHDPQDILGRLLEEKPPPTEVADFAREAGDFYGEALAELLIEHDEDEDEDEEPVWKKERY